MLDEMFTFGIFSYVSLFVMVDPIGNLPIFLGMTNKLNPHQQNGVALRATLISYLILIAIAFTGQAIFRFFDIRIEELKIVGGIIFFIVGYEMLHARLSRTNIDEESTHDYAHDIALTPLGIPMLCGPGAMANTMVLWNLADSIPKKMTVIITLTLVMVTTLIILLGGKRLTKFLGESGNKVMLRLMGLITMVIAVHFFFDGLKPILRDILNIPEKAAG
ncbi:MarC family protein [Telmatocola sphagniphila]|uniref:UPF0056 membrane protein n=1 Tax=Telmatocola sphagniphila TaxID=1123043 RepID=A0A8E6B9N6_9BACT|nr:MarC family protein [Telmatocola sphagniphila]QVL34393.1 MarC family protein [Telmatocola sphagniphila]